MQCLHTTLQLDFCVVGHSASLVYTHFASYNDTAVDGHMSYDPSSMACYCTRRRVGKSLLQKSAFCVSGKGIELGRVWQGG